MQETYILRYAKSPRFELENHNHIIIAELSKRAHELTRKAHYSREPAPKAERELRRVEEPDVRELVLRTLSRWILGASNIAMASSRYTTCRMS